MTKTEELNQLFEEWQGRSNIFENDFYKDGIINETVWDASQVKILYILKEVYETGTTSVCDFLKSNDIQKGYDEKSDTWRKVAYLSSGILNAKEDNNQMELERMKEKHIYASVMDHIAIMNIKKCGGGANCESEKSKRKGTYVRHAKEYGDLIRRQIEIIAPNVIICCSTFDECKKYIFNPDGGYEFCQEVNEERFAINVLKNNCIVFNNYHPTAWNWKAKKCDYFDPIVEYCKKQFN